MPPAPGTAGRRLRRVSHRWEGMIKRWGDRENVDTETFVSPGLQPGRRRSDGPVATSRQVGTQKGEQKQLHQLLAGSGPGTGPLPGGSVQRSDYAVQSIPQFWDKQVPPFGRLSSGDGSSPPRECRRGPVVAGKIDPGMASPQPSDAQTQQRDGPAGARDDLANSVA